MAVMDVGEVRRITASIPTDRLLAPGVTFSVLVAAAAFARVAAGGGLTGMWADDGIYLEVVRTSSPWSSITHAHQGYLNFVPMLIATTLEWVPLRAVPAVYIAVWASVVGALASLIAACSATFLDSIWSRAALGASVALVPVAGFESVGSIANLQWALLATSTIVLVGAAPTRTTERVGAVVLALTAASAPAALVLAPLVWWRRERRWYLAAWLVGTAAQMLAVVSTWGQRDPAGRWYEFGQILRSFVAVGANGVTEMAPSYAYLSGVTVAFMVLIGIAAMRDHRRLTAPALLVAAALLQWWFTFTGGGDVAVVPRYGIVPAICVLAVVLAASEPDRRIHAMVLCVLALCWIGEGAASTYRTAGPDWSEQLASTQCVGGVRELALVPDGWGTIELPCDG